MGKHAQGSTAPAHNHRLHDQLQGQGIAWVEGWAEQGDGAGGGGGLKGIPFSEDLGGGVASAAGWGSVMGSRYNVHRPPPVRDPYFPIPSIKPRPPVFSKAPKRTLIYYFLYFSRNKSATTLPFIDSTIPTRYRETGFCCSVVWLMLRRPGRFPRGSRLYRVPISWAVVLLLIEV